MIKLVFTIIFLVCFSGILIGQLIPDNDWTQYWQYIPMPEYLPFYQDKSWSIESITLNEKENQIEVIRSYYYQPMHILPSLPPRSPRPVKKAKKRIYGVVDGKIKLIKTLNAVYIDSVVTKTTQKTIEKRIFKE